MDFNWSDKQIKLRDDVSRFARAELNTGVTDRDKKGEFPYEHWQLCADQGILGLATPSIYGGREEEIDILSSMIAMEGFGYGCLDNGLAFGLNAQMWTVQLPIVQFGTSKQKEQFLPALTNGSFIGADALTEPEAGSDIFNMKTTAEKCEGGYILNGEKRLISFAPIANMVLVYASTNSKLGKWGISAFLVEKDTDGLIAGPVQDKMGLRTIPIGGLTFNNCFVPEENRLGKEGAGFSIMNYCLEYERCSILSSQLGAMQRQLEDTIAFAKEREQFGQPIGKFQSVSHRIVDMKLRLETARLLLYKVAWLKHEGKPAMMEAALLKLHLSQSFVDSSIDAIRTHGGNGFLTEFEVERDLRDAIGGLLYAGTSDIQKNIVSNLLGL